MYEILTQGVIFGNFGKFWEVLGSFGNFWEFLVILKTALVIFELFQRELGHF